MAATALVVDLLGGERALGRKVSSKDKLVALLRGGLPYPSLEAVMEALEISREEASASLSVPLRTLARRKKERRLRADESDRLYRLANTAAHAVEVLGGKKAAAAWLRRPNRALGGQPPLALLDTEVGVERVDDLLGHIEHGMLS